MTPCPATRIGSALRELVKAPGTSDPHLFLAALAAVLMLIAVSVQTASAGTKKLAIYGDSLATGLYQGMQDLLEGTHQFDVIRHSKGGTGLVRDDEYDWVARAEQYVQKDRPDVVIVSLGGNDRQNFSFPGFNVERFSDEWWFEYMRRAEQVMMSLKRKAKKVYWLGIPVVRSQRMTADYEKLNVMFRELTRVHGIIYVDIWDKFRGPDKRFTSYERVSGRNQRVRLRDGIHFTRFGNQLLAQVVTGAMRQELASAK